MLLPESTQNVSKVIYRTNLTATNKKIKNPSFVTFDITSNSWYRRLVYKTPADVTAAFPNFPFPLNSYWNANVLFGLIQSLLKKDKVMFLVKFDELSALVHGASQEEPNVAILGSFLVALETYARLLRQHDKLGLEHLGIGQTYFLANVLRVEHLRDGFELNSVVKWKSIAYQIMNMFLPCVLYPDQVLLVSEFFKKNN